MEENESKKILSQLQGLQDVLSAGGSLGCGCGSHHRDPVTVARQNFYGLLIKLGLKSPPVPGYGHLVMEDLSAVMKQVTFDMKDLQHWTKLNLNGKEEK